MYGADDDAFTGLAPTGRLPAGAGPFGHLDMAGNVAEWTETRGGILLLGRVVHGGHLASRSADEVRGTARVALPEDTSSATLGFRCAR